MRARRVIADATAVGEEVVAGQACEFDVEMRSRSHTLVARGGDVEGAESAPERRDRFGGCAFAAEAHRGGLERIPQLAELGDLAEVDRRDLPGPPDAFHEAVAFESHQRGAERGAGCAELRFEAALGEAGARRALEVEDLGAQVLVHVRLLGHGRPSVWYTDAGIPLGYTERPADAGRSTVTATITRTRTARPWLMLALGVVAQASSTVFVSTPAFLIPLLHTERGLSLAEAGLLASTPTLGMVMTLIAWGALSDRIGERWVIASGLAVTALAAIGAMFASGYIGLGFFLLIGGMASASPNAASGRVVVGWFPRERRGLAMGIRQMCQPLGVAIAAVSIPILAPPAAFPPRWWFPRC